MNSKHFTKAEKEQRLSSETTFRLGREQLVAPAFLSARARAEFERILAAAFWLDNLDFNDLTLYCFYWDKAQSIVEDYDGQPEVMEIPNGDFAAKVIGNPLRKALREYHAEMRAISLKLGLSSIDRLKLVAPTEEKRSNKFASLVERG